MTIASITIDGESRQVAADVTLAVALLNLGLASFRRDSTGAPRAPLCGMGTCFECRVTVDGQPGVRSCMLRVRDGMTVSTGS
jgi:sarcosine oxidase subunit alpha